MPLVDIAKELLLIILDELPLRSIECLALTFNRIITHACIPYLEPVFRERRHAKRITQPFGPIEVYPYTSLEVMKEEASRIGVEDKNCLTCPPPDSFTDLSYLQLNGDLYWLKPLDTRTEQSIIRHFRKSIPKAETDQLVASCERVDLGEGGLRKFPVEYDGGAGGYIVRLYSQQDGGYFWGLYIEPGEDGAHCIIGARNDMNLAYIEENNEILHELGLPRAEEVKAADEDTEPAVISKDRFRLEGIGFEQWLVTMYFEQWLWFVTHFKQHQALAPLKEYVRLVYGG